MPQTALQLTQKLARKVSWPVPTSIDSTTDLKEQKLLDALNAVGIALGHYYFWPFLMKETNLTLVDDITAGDCDVTNGSATVTSDNADTDWTGAVGRLFKVNGYQEAYRITAVAAPTNPASMTIDHVYNGVTNTDQGFVIAQDEYDMPSDFDHILSVVHYVGPDHLEITTPEKMDRHRFGPWGTTMIGTTSSMTVGLPRRATLVGRDDGTNDHLYKIVLDPMPDQDMILPIKYYALLAEHDEDSDTWPFPFYLEQVIIDGAAAKIRTDGQDDTRASFNLQEFFLGRNELAGLTPTHAMSAQFQPDTGVYRRAARRRRVSPGRYDLGWEIINERS